MSQMTRRRFLSRTGAAVICSAPAAAAGLSLRTDGQEWSGGGTGGQQAAILYDSTLCIGCRACEMGCADENQLARTSGEIFEGCTFLRGGAYESVPLAQRSIPASRSTPFGPMLPS